MYLEFFFCSLRRVDSGRWSRYVKVGNFLSATLERRRINLQLVFSVLQLINNGENVPLDLATAVMARIATYLAVRFPIFLSATYSVDV